MKLEKLEINGFRKLFDTVINFGDATFLIGHNNVGKSSVFDAIRLILKNEIASKDDYSMKCNPTSKTNECVSDKIVLIATFSNVPPEANTWLGFHGRLYKENDQLKIKYRKTFNLYGSPKIEMFEQKRELATQYLEGTKITIQSIIRGGIDEHIVREHFENISDTQNLNTKQYSQKLECFYEVWNFIDEYDWIENPGGIPQNVLCKLPKFIYIPAEHKADEINSNKSSALGEVMTTIFEDIIEASDNYEKVKEYFGELAKEIDTDNEDTEFGKIMIDVNKTIKNIFPDSQIYAKVNLSDPNSFLKPTYEIKLGSNILTDVKYQGTGMIRSTAFSLLRFRENWRKQREQDLRNIIICFEEPEIFLHPNAANQMRDTIYDLANNENQIVCTSHSPYMIDLSRDKKNQIISCLSIKDDTFVKSYAFNVTQEFLKLEDNDRSYVKLVLKIDDYIARAFFCKRVIIVEGDTEDVLFRKTISLIDKNKRAKILSDIQVIKARGKATIAPLIKYFNALGIYDIYVIHDKDTGNANAEVFNPIILHALDNNESRRCMLEECVEDILGYTPPAKDKPYKAFTFSEAWQSYNNIPAPWLNVINKVFNGYV